MTRLYILLAALVVCLFGGAYVMHRLHKVKELEQAVQTSEEYRDAERLNARSRSKTMDEYTQRLKTESDRAAAARADLARVLNAPAYQGSAEGADTCRADRARIGELEELLKQGASLAVEGSAHVESLRTDRAALIEVAK